MENDLENVSLPSSLKEVGARAFSDNNLTDIDLPLDAKRIDHEAFVNNSIASVIIGSETKYFDSTDDKPTFDSGVEIVVE